MTINLDRNIEALNFEKYILSLLNALAKSKNQEFYSEYFPEKDYIWYAVDGLAPDGLGDIKGSTVVEIKYLPRFNKKRIHDIIKQLNSFLEKSDSENIILVTNVKSKSKIENNNPRIIIWDENDIKNL